MKDLVRLLRRIAVTIAGIVILAVGAVLLVAPGPGVGAIGLGAVLRRTGKTVPDDDAG